MTRLALLTIPLAACNGSCERSDLRNELCATWTCAEPEHAVLLVLGKDTNLCVCVPPEELGQ